MRQNTHQMTDNMQMKPQILLIIHQYLTESTLVTDVRALQNNCSTSVCSHSHHLGNGKLVQYSYTWGCCVWMSVFRCVRGVCRGIPIRQGEYAWPAYSCDEWVWGFVPQCPSLHYCHMEQMVPFTTASHVHTHTHTHTEVLGMPPSCDVHTLTCRGQGGLMNSTPQAAPALSWGVNLQIWRATKQKIRSRVWNVKQTKERVIEWSRE